jgi:hypothetical protein
MSTELQIEPWPIKGLSIYFAIRTVQGTRNLAAEYLSRLKLPYIVFEKRAEGTNETTANYYYHDLPTRGGAYRLMVETIGPKLDKNSGLYLFDDSIEGVTGDRTSFYDMIREGLDYNRALVGPLNPHRSRPGMRNHIDVGPYSFQVFLDRVIGMRPIAGNPWDERFQVHEDMDGCATIRETYGPNSIVRHNDKLIIARPSMCMKRHGKEREYNYKLLREKHPGICKKWLGNSNNLIKKARISKER